MAAVRPAISATVRAWHLWLALLCIGAVMVLPAEWTGLFYRYGGSTVVSLLAALVILGLMQQRDSVVSRLLGLSVLTWVGKRSYGIYLWNLPIIGLMAMLPLRGVLDVPVKAVVCLLLPALSYTLVEQPILRRVKRPKTSAATT